MKTLNITDAQMQRVAEMLGTPKVVWSKAGAYFCGAREPAMDALVVAGLLEVHESVENWGPCVVYVATETARNRLAAVLLGKL